MFFIFFSFFPMSALALAYFIIWYTHRTRVVLCYKGQCDIRVLFMYDASQCAWRIEPIIFNNVRLSTLMLYQIQQACCVRAYSYHYTTRASRNEVSNKEAIEFSFYSTHVPNSCRKWNKIFIFLFSFTVHCIWCILLCDEWMSCLSVSRCQTTRKTRYVVSPILLNIS